MLYTMCVDVRNYILYYIERGVNSNSVITHYSESSIYMDTPPPPVTLVFKYFIGNLKFLDFMYLYIIYFL